MLDHYYAVIMAGGGGTRLWPLSRRSRPKQMLSLFDERTLFQTSVERLRAVFPADRIFVVTVAEQAQDLQTQCPFIPVENYLLEPMPRGTASVVGFAAAVLQKRDPQAIMAVLTADHYIGNVDNFHSLLETAWEVAQDGYLVTLGITPTFPATGFGYIQQSERIGEYRGFPVYRVLRFTEKPDDAQARQMIATGDHTWNSGMFFWRVERIMGEFHRQMPELAIALEEIYLAWGTLQQDAVLERVWPSIKVETIDYGIMEGASRVAVIPASNLEWNDVGSWDALFDVLPTDMHGNIVIGGEHVGIDTSKSLIYVTQEHRMIVTIGIEDLVLVDTGDVLLVSRKDQVQRVRQVVNHLKQKGHNSV